MIMFTELVFFYLSARSIISSSRALNKPTIFLPQFNWNDIKKKDTDIHDRKQQMRQHSQMLPFPSLGFRGGPK